MGRGRGRPKGVKNKVEVNEVSDPQVEIIDSYPVPSSYLFLGYCVECEVMITDKDKEKDKVKCPGCGKVQGMAKLRQRKSGSESEDLEFF